MYKEIKPTFGGEIYLKMKINTRLGSCLTKLRLSSHNFLVVRGRWLNLCFLPTLLHKSLITNVPVLHDIA